MKSQKIFYFSISSVSMQTCLTADFTPFSESADQKDCNGFCPFLSETYSFVAKVYLSLRMCIWHS